MQYSLEEIRNTPILFIVGKGRSGTTLMSTILDSHPEVASATESRFLLILWQKYKHMKNWKPTMAEEFLEDVWLDLRIKNLWEFESDFLTNLKSLSAETKPQDLIKLVYLQRKSSFPKDKLRYIIDKNPMYTLFVNQLIEIFPDALFYRLIRDPRDNVASHIKYSKNEEGMLALKWLRYNQDLDDFAEQHPKQFKTQKFEDLILSKEAFFKEFENYSGIKDLLSHESKRMAYKEELQGKLNQRLKDQHQASVKPLDKSKIGHYKKKLSIDAIKDIEGLAFPYAENYGYQAEEYQKPKIKWSWKRAYFMQRNLSLLFYNMPFWVMKGVSKYLVKKVKYVESKQEAR